MEDEYDDKENNEGIGVEDHGDEFWPRIIRLTRIQFVCSCHSWRYKMLSY